MSVALGRRLGLRGGDALVVVDVQRDFLPHGSLPVPRGDEVIGPLNAYLAAFDARDLPIFVTRDWHPAEHCSFRSAGGRWPVHCVQGTSGAAWPPALRIPPSAHVVSKGTERSAEALSAFRGTSLAALLADLHVERIFVGGLATEYCVHDTVRDAISHGLRAVVLADAIRGINAQEGDADRAVQDLLMHGASLHVPPRSARNRSRAAPTTHG